RRAVLGILPGYGGLGRDVGRGRGEVIDDDPIGPGELFVADVRVALSDVSGRAPGQDGQRQHPWCNPVKTLHGHTSEAHHGGRVWPAYVMPLSCGRGLA